MLNFFRKKPDTEKLASLIHGGLLLQIALGYGMQITQADDWILGYAFGFSEGVLRATDIDDQPASLEAMHKVFHSLYSSPQLAQQQLDRALELRRSPEFTEGALLGSKQAMDLIRDRKPPMGLARRLQGARRQGSNQEVISLHG